MPLHLHVFEDRYKLMVNHSLAEDSLLGIVLIHQGLEALGPLPQPYHVGTLGRIVEWELLQDGCMNITVLGMDRFRILNSSAEIQPYLVGSVENDPVELPSLIQVHRQSRRLAASLQRYLVGLSLAKIENMDLSRFSPPDDPMSLVFLAAALLQIPPYEKQPILEAASINQMMEMVERLYRRENGLMATINATEGDSARRAAWLN